MLADSKREDNMLCVGVDAENVDVQFINTDVSVHLIVGAPQSGKTNVLRLIAHQGAGLRLFITDSRGYDLQPLSTIPNITYAGNEADIQDFYTEFMNTASERKSAFEASGGGQRPKDFYSKLPPVIMLIDDADRFIEICKPIAQKMEQLITQAVDCGICIVASTLPSRLRGYDNISKLLKEAQSGIILGNPTEQSLFSFQAPRGYKQQPDMGFLYSRGSGRLIKIPLI
jgi:S-DNA-T family DNA segregation ATPase FtsK/SpoIIIE